MKGLPARRCDGSVNIVVESPRGASSKFKYESAGDVFMLSRLLPAGLAYPHDWSFIPSTRGSDGDPLDAMVFWEGSSVPGIVLPCRLLGVLRVEQNRKMSPGRERNDRMLAIPVGASALETIRSIGELPPHVCEEIERCFENAVASYEVL
jgi:inorganic pyrophosphatase